MAELLPSALTAPLEVTYSIEEVQLLKAVDQFKRENDVKFPSLREIMAVMRALGYRKVAEPTELPRVKRQNNGKNGNGDLNHGGSGEIDGGDRGVPPKGRRSAKRAC